MQHLEILKNGLHNWNRWRQENPSIIPILRSEDLSFIDTRQLLWGDMQKPVSWVQDHGRGERLNLSCCDLTEANLSEATLISVDFSNSIGADANFSGCDLRGATFTGCDFRRANFTNTDLRGSSLGKLGFGRGLERLPSHNSISEKPQPYSYSPLIFREVASNFSGADFTECDLRDANLTQAKLSKARLVRADLRHTHGFRSDENHMQGAVFDLDYGLFSKNFDPWIALKRVYTFPKSILSLVFLLVFLTPHIAHVMLLALAGLGSELLHQYDPNITAQINTNTITVLQLFLGYGSGLFGTIAVCGLIIYNTCRFVLTQMISNLRESEIVTGISPKQRPENSLRDAEGVVDFRSRIGVLLLSYHWMYLSHRVLAALFWLSLILGLQSVYQLLMLPVPIPL